MSRSPRRSARRSLILILLLTVALPLAACGRKPGTVDAPPGAADTGFPRTYPNPDLDPEP